MIAESVDLPFSQRASLTACNLTDRNADTSLFCNAGKQLPPMQSLAAKSLSHLIDSALHLYGVPRACVRQTVGVSCSAWQAPVVAQKLHVGSKDTAAVLLIGDAAMQV